MLINVGQKQTLQYRDTKLSKKLRENAKKVSISNSLAQLELSFYLEIMNLYLFFFFKIA